MGNFPLQTQEQSRASTSEPKGKKTRVNQIVEGLVVGHNVPRELLDNLLKEHRQEILSGAATRLTSFGHSDAEISMILES